MKTMTNEYKKRLRIHACRNINYLLDKLGINYRQNGVLIQAKCPCGHHSGDGNNPTAFSWRVDYEHWRCWTHHCNEKFGNDIYGLVRSVMDCSFAEAQSWTEEQLKKQNIDITKEVESLQRKNNTEVYFHQPIDTSFIKFLNPENPPSVMLDRGFSENVLRSYQVGRWNRLGTFMDKRVVIPVRDHDGRLVGFTGRDMSGSDDPDVSKWVHGRYYDRFSGELKCSSILFNLDRAKDFIPDRRIIVCEGPFDGFVFEMAGIKNWVCTLGTSFQPQHRSLLIKYGINEIVLAYDPDDAGYVASERLSKVVGELIKVNKMENLESDPGSYSLHPERLKALYEATIKRAENVKA